MSTLLFPLPETRAEVVRALILEDLAGFTYWPQVKHEPMEGVRKTAFDKQERRKLLPEPEPITNFGENL